MRLCRLSKSRRVGCEWRNVLDVTNCLTGTPVASDTGIVNANVWRAESVERRAMMGRGEFLCDDERQRHESGEVDANCRNALHRRVMPCSEPVGISHNN